MGIIEVELPQSTRTGRQRFSQDELQQALELVQSGRAASNGVQYPASGRKNAQQVAWEMRQGIAEVSDGAIATEDLKSKTFETEVDGKTVYTFAVYLKDGAGDVADESDESDEDETPES